MIQQDDLMDEVKKELHGYTEEFFGTSLELTAIYGLHLFPNDSLFKMHLDRKGNNHMG